MINMDPKKMNTDSVGPKEKPNMSSVNVSNAEVACDATNLATSAIAKMVAAFLLMVWRPARMVGQTRNVAGVVSVFIVI